MPSANLEAVMPLAEDLTQILSRCCESTSEDCMAKEVRWLTWSSSRDVLRTVNRLPVFSAAFPVRYSILLICMYKIQVHSLLWLPDEETESRGLVIGNTQPVTKIQMHTRTRFPYSHALYCAEYSLPTHGYINLIIISSIIFKLNTI